MHTPFGSKVVVEGRVASCYRVVMERKMLVVATLLDPVRIEPERPAFPDRPIENLPPDTAKHAFEQTGVSHAVEISSQRMYGGELQVGYHDLGRRYVLPDIGPHARQVARGVVRELVEVVREICTDSSGEPRAPLDAPIQRCIGG